MEFFLFLIFLLVAYIAIKIRSALLPVLRNLSTFPVKTLKGKTFVQVEILLPRQNTKSSLEINYEVTSNGLTKTLSVDALADFDSLSKKNKFCFSKQLKISTHETTRVGSSDGVVALFTKVQDIALQGEIECSQQSFDLIIQQLTDQKPIVLRAYCLVLRTEVDRITVASDSFSILTEESRSPNSFCRSFKQYIEHLNQDDSELLLNFSSKYDLSHSVI